jgi:hypothetical protein
MLKNRFLLLLGLLIILHLWVALPCHARVEHALPGNSNLLIEGFLENYTIMRSDDFRFSKQMQLASMRNTVQLELTVEKLLRNCGFIDRVDLFAIIRTVYDGVYDLNPNTYGDEAPNFQRSGSTSSQFLRNPWRTDHFTESLLPGLLPVMPRADLPGGKNVGRTPSDLEWGHNDSADERELRELYLDITAGRHWLRLGKQQIVWGKTDFFRSQDIPNPIDFGRHGFYDSWEDIRIPQWSARYQYQAGSLGPLDNVALELVWLWDDFEATGLGQGGEPWSHPFAQIIRQNAMAYQGFQQLARDLRATGVPIPATNLLGQGIMREQDPGMSLRNSEWGMRLEWRWNDWRFALTNWFGFQDDALFHLIQRWVNYEPYPGRPYDFVNGPFPPLGVPPATGEPVFNALADLGLIPPGAAFVGGLASIEYPRRDTLGLAVDYYNDLTKTVWRIESSITFREAITNVDQVDYADYSEVVRWSVGIDRPTFLFFLNPTKTFFLSTQFLFKHVVNHNGGEHTGMIVWPNEFTFTALAQTEYYRDRIRPQVWFAFNPQYNATTGGINCEWLITDNWSIKSGLNIIGGQRQRHDLDPFWSFAAPATSTTFNRVQEWPYGIAKEGFGSYRHLDEMYFVIRYRF